MLKLLYYNMKIGHSVSACSSFRHVSQVFYVSNLSISNKLRTEEIMKKWL